MATPAPKPVYKRFKPTAKQRGAISPSVRREVRERSGNCCERCGKNEYAAWTLEMAHTRRRWRIEGETTAQDLVHLCGPSTQSGTCHHWADYTAEGRAWLERFHEQLRSDEE